MDNHIITRTTATRIISLLDWVYREGIQQAREVDDEGMCREFIDTHRKVGVFGFLEDGLDIGCLEWQLRLQAKARLTHNWGAMHNYFKRMGKYTRNPLSCLLPLAQEWHCMGVEDYIKNPDSCNFDIFIASRRKRWTRKGLINIQIDEWIETIQLKCFELRREHEVYLLENDYSSDAKRITIKPNQWDIFIRMVSLAKGLNY